MDVMDKLIGILAFILIFAICCGLSWIATCGLIYAICYCFALEFSWLIATGIWLVFLLINFALM